MRLDGPCPHQDSRWWPNAYLLAELWPEPWDAASSFLREPVREKRLLPPSCLLMLLAVRLVGTVAKVLGNGTTYMHTVDCHHGTVWPGQHCFCLLVQVVSDWGWLYWGS